MTTPPGGSAASEDWDNAYTNTHPTADTSNGDDSEPPKPVFDNVETFVNDYLAQLIRRPTSNSWCWCPRWWEHAEAIARLEALWRSWESLRLDGTTGMSVWFRDHLEPHLGMLTDIDRSPFSECHNGTHTENPPLPVEPAPPEWWGDQPT